MGLELEEEETWKLETEARLNVRWHRDALGSRYDVTVEMPGQNKLNRKIVEEMMK